LKVKKDDSDLIEIPDVLRKLEVVHCAINRGKSRTGGWLIPVSELKRLQTEPFDPLCQLYIMAITITQIFLIEVYNIILRRLCIVDNNLASLWRDYVLENSQVQDGVTNRDVTVDEDKTPVI
jgi:hypothetical protein